MGSYSREKTIRHVDRLHKEMGCEDLTFDDTCPAVIATLRQIKPGKIQTQRLREAAKQYLIAEEGRQTDVSDAEICEQVKNICRGMMFVYQHGDEQARDILHHLNIIDMIELADIGDGPTHNFKPFLELDVENEGYNVVMPLRTLVRHREKYDRLDSRRHQHEDIEGFYSARDLAILTGVDAALEVIQAVRQLPNLKRHDESERHPINEAVHSTNHYFQHEQDHSEAVRVLEAAAKHFRLGSIYGPQRILQISSGPI